MGEAISRKLDTADIKEFGQDTKIWLHKGNPHISRIYPHQELNQKESQAPEMLLPRALPLMARSMDGQLMFEQQTQQLCLSAHEIEAQVLISGLQPSSSGPQLLIYDIVLRAGSSVDQCLVGRRIITFSHDGLETLVYTTAYAVLAEDEDTPPETLLADLLPLYPIINLCLYRHHVNKGDFLLALPGPKAFVITLVKLAKAVGWKFYIVLNLREEKK